MRQRLDAGVDGRALGRIVEQPGVLEGVVAVLALERVHHPGDVAHAADHLGVGEQPHQRRQLGGPGAVGVEDHRLLEVGVVGVEQAAQDARALRLVDHGGELGAGRDLRDHAVEQRGDRARHAGVEARVLPQDRGGQRRARARQAGDEVPPPLHQVPPPHASAKSLLPAPMEETFKWLCNFPDDRRKRRRTNFPIYGRGTSRGRDPALTKRQPSYSVWARPSRHLMRATRRQP